MQKKEFQEFQQNFPKFFLQKIFIKNKIFSKYFKKDSKNLFSIKNDSNETNDKEVVYSRQKTSIIY